MASARLAMFLARSPMRSTSPEMRIAEIVSQVHGERLPPAIMRIACSSTSLCSTSRRASAAITLWARGVSRRTSDVMLSASIFSAMPPISEIWRRRS